MSRLRVDLQVTDDQFDGLVQFALMHGFKREEPRKAWTNRERREAAVWAVRRTITGE